MTRNLKALGLALVAVFALSAVAVASASADTFTSDQASTILTGTSKVATFSAAGATVKCEHATYSGTQTGKAVEEVTVHPEYDTNCKVEGLGVSATVDTDGCDYILTGKTEGGHAKSHIECTTGHSIKITTSLCNFFIGTQTPTQGVTYTNGTENGKGDVTVTATVTGIKNTASGGFCFLLENGGASEKGVYTDSVTVTGYEDKGSSRDATSHKWTFTEGAQINVSVDTP